jgi:transposase-like protein
VRSFDPTFEPKEMVGIRRLEVITGVGGRRTWSDEDKGRIVAASFAAAANVSAVARQYGLTAAGLCLATAGSRRHPGAAVGRGAGVRAGYCRAE